MSRYRRLVPPAARRLIKLHRLGRPNWYVGSAESSWASDVEDVPITPAMRREIDELKARIQGRRDAMALDDQQCHTSQAADRTREVRHNDEEASR